MEYYIFLLGSFFAIIGYLILVVDKIKYGKKSGKINGFEQAKDITSNYEDINIVESKEILVSKYLLKRKLIRLTSKMYDATDTFSIAMVSFLAGISLITNQYLDYLKKVLPSIDFINKSSIIMIIISYLLHTKMDARIGIILGLIILFYQYCYLQVVSDSIKVIDASIQRDVRSILSRFYKVNAIFFVSTLTLLLRFIMIIIK